MNLIWRFYLDQKQLWRWQRLSVSLGVVAESPAAYKEYDGCVANAQAQGYVFLPPLTTRIQSQEPSTKKKR